MRRRISNYKRWRRQISSVIRFIMRRGLDL